MRSATYFISDLHLGATYDPSSRQREMHVVRFLDHIKTDAKTLYLLGDILDYWYEYRYVVPKGHIRLFGKLAELTDSGVEVIWLTGNHDIWLFDYLPSEIGVRIVDASLDVKIDGQMFHLAHGDRTGCDSTYFRLMQRLFRNRVCQWLYAGIHPRWTVPFALKWSSSSRRKSRLSSEQNQAEQALGRLQTFATDYLITHPHIRYFIFGHLHIVERRQLLANHSQSLHGAPSQVLPANPSELIVIGDWLTHFSYARFDKGLLTLNYFPLS